MPNKPHIEIGGLTESLIFLPPDDNDITDTDKKAARQVLRTAMMGWAHASDEHLSNLVFSWRVFHSVFWKKNKALFELIRKEYEAGFEHIYEQLENKTFTDAQNQQIQLYLSNCLNLLPFAGLNPYRTVMVPQLIHGIWQPVEFKPVPIELTATSGFEKLFIQEKDRVFAYGLEPVNNQDAEPHLIFMGTGYPANQGFEMQVHTDLEGFETAGKKLYRTGHARISQFLDKQIASGKKTRVSGVSLGGGLSLLLAADQGHKLSRIDAQNPPGLYHPFKKSQYDNWDKIVENNEAPLVVIQQNLDDPVSIFGVWKKEWHVLKLTPEADMKAPHSGIAHILNYAGQKDTHFEPIDIEKENEKRWLLNTLVYAGLRGLIYYSIVMPYHYVVRPALYYALQHPIEICLMLLPFAAASILPAAVVSILTLVATVVALYCAMSIIHHAANTLLGLNEVLPIEEHLPETTVAYINPITNDEAPEEISEAIPASCSI